MFGATLLFRERSYGGRRRSDFGHRMLWNECVSYAGRRIEDKAGRSAAHGTGAPGDAHRVPLHAKSVGDFTHPVYRPPESQHTE
jgi:hypothetical protein